ncbi:uridine kinase [Saccharopolyspora taberi]|uniref:Uridine kinase n=1 Tax=Saccharopolyspora taberi TaxID=60895 RepID=A0ABN3VI47_9PSEU
MRVRPVSPELLVSELVDRIESVDARWPRVAVDGAPEAGTSELADALVEPLRVRGRDVVRIRMSDYLRPASLRLERGREDPDSYYEDWFDLAGLRREVLDPLSRNGTGEVLPALWDAAADRSPRLDRVRLADRGVAVVDGPLLLGAGLPFDFAVHLWLPPAALERRVTSWQLPAFRRYADEVGPERVADALVRADRPGRPAVVDSLE